jgi:hypothetical protein
VTKKVAADPLRSVAALAIVGVWTLVYKIRGYTLIDPRIPSGESVDATLKGDGT